MIGPVSATGQTMLQSLQNAMSKGMPVDQAIAYVKSMAMDGIAPLTDLYAMMLQFQRLKEPQRRPPEGGSIREQLQSLQNPQPPQDPMMMGIGGMNAGTMENPSFAGGGIVAFQQGGGAQSQAPGMTPELYGQIPEFSTYAEAAKAYRARAQDPKLVQQEMARREAIAREQGIGEFGKSFELREEMLGDDKRRAQTVAAEEAEFDEDEYWGDVAANAAQSGATLLTSLAKAQKGKATRKRATAEKVRMAVREAKQTEILLEQAREAEKAGRYKEAEALRAEAAKKAEDAQLEVAKAAEKEAQDLRSRDTQYGVAERYTRSKGVEKEREELFAELRSLQRQGKTNTPEYKNKMELYQNSFQQVAAAKVREGAKPNPADMQKLKNLGRQLELMTYSSANNPNKINIENEYNALYGKLTRSGVNPEDIESELRAGAQGGAQGASSGFTVLGSRPAQ